MDMVKLSFLFLIVQILLLANCSDDPYRKRFIKSEDGVYHENFFRTEWGIRTSPNAPIFPNPPLYIPDTIIAGVLYNDTLRAESPIGDKIQYSFENYTHLSNSCDEFDYATIYGSTPDGTLPPILGLRYIDSLKRQSIFFSIWATKFPTEIDDERARLDVTRFVIYPLDYLKQKELEFTAVFYKLLNVWGQGVALIDSIFAVVQDTLADPFQRVDFTNLNTPGEILDLQYSILSHSDSASATLSPFISDGNFYLNQQEISELTVNQISFVIELKNKWDFSDTLVLFIELR